MPQITNSLVQKSFSFDEWPKLSGPELHDILSNITQMDIGYNKCLIEFMKLLLYIMDVLHLKALKFHAAP